MIRKTIVAALLASAAPAAAQTASAPAAAPQAAPAAAAALDPARVAAARRLVDQAVPPAVMEQIARLGVTGAYEARRADAEAARRDPHHAERIRLEEPVAMAEASRVLRDIDPNLRQIFVESFARTFAAADLDEIGRFYASPIGRRLMSGGFAVATRPEYSRAMEALDAHLFNALEGAGGRFAAATAGLPPLPGMPTPEQMAAASAAAAAEGRAARAAAPAAPAPARAPADPARLAAARRAIDLMWPSETFRRPLNFVPAAETIAALRFGDFGIPIPPSAGLNPNSTIAEMATGFDPHFRQRLPVMVRFAGAELARLMTAMEPEWKRITADEYAREFTVAELDEVSRFLATPAGRRLTTESVRMMEDPQLVRGLVLLIPRVVMQMPAIEQRIKQATAHLPPVPTPPAPPIPRPGTEGADEDEDQPTSSQD